jgi:hypothetical protein
MNSAWAMQCLVSKFDSRVVYLKQPWTLSGFDEIDPAYSDLYCGTGSNRQVCAFGGQRKRFEQAAPSMVVRGVDAIKGDSHHRVHQFIPNDQQTGTTVSLGQVALNKAMHRPPRTQHSRVIGRQVNAARLQAEKRFQNDRETEFVGGRPSFFERAYKACRWHGQPRLGEALPLLPFAKHVGIQQFDVVLQTVTTDRCEHAQLIVAPLEYDCSTMIEAGSCSHDGAEFGARVGQSQYRWMERPRREHAYRRAFIAGPFSLVSPRDNHAVLTPSCRRLQACSSAGK